MATYHRAVTPAELTPTIRGLCEAICPGGEPNYVDVRPAEGEGANECFHVVQRQVEAAGGSRIIGWSIWELPSVFVEAEFHSVWQSSSGELVDLTPKKEFSARILFLPDPVHTYLGVQRNSIRRAISSDPVVAEYLNALDRRFAFMNRGERALMHGEIRFAGPDAAEYESIEAEIDHLGMQVLLLYPRVGPYSPCLCGSGKKAKWCHGAT